MKRLARKIYADVPFKRQAYVFLRNRLGITPTIFQHLHFTGPFELPIDNEHKITLYSAGNIVENELFWLGFGNGWEATSLQLWQRICADSQGSILDIGANSGVYALVAAAMAPKATIIAFEPIARVASELRRNIALNGFSIGVEECAVSNRDGATTIFDATDAHNYSASLEGQGPGATQTQVPVCTIDSFLSARGADPVAAVKIDVERHEPAVMQGMRKALTKDRPAVLIEILDDQIGAAVAEQMDGLGYRMFHIAEGTGIVPAERLSPLEDHDWNHLLCTPEQFDQLRLAEFLSR